MYIFASRKYDELIQHTTDIEIKLDRLEQENGDLKQKIMYDQAKIEHLDGLVSILEEQKNAKLSEIIKELN